MRRIESFLERLPVISEPGCDWVDFEAISVMRRWQLILRELLAYVSFFLARATPIQQFSLAPSIWRELHQSLLQALRGDNARMRDSADCQEEPLQPPDPQPTKGTCTPRDKSCRMPRLYGTGGHSRSQSLRTLLLQYLFPGVWGLDAPFVAVE